jgi:type IV pilus assembly protein PilE
MKLRYGNTGFTLIELMAVIIIVSVLMLVALPAYQNYVIRGHRAAAKGEMLELANRQQQFLLANRTYTNDPDTLAYDPPPDVDAFYSFELSTVSASGVPFFEITFTPKPGTTQAEDGDLTLDSEGKKEPEDKWAR